MRSAVEGVIYAYIFICAALLVFNVVYIMRDTFVEKRKLRRIEWWRGRLTEGAYTTIPDECKSKLKRIEHLIAFHTVVSEVILPEPDTSARFFFDNISLFRSLALEYSRDTAMERAYFAYVIASFRTPLETKHDNLLEILLAFMDNSTVYLRENVLQAFYSLGSEQALEQAMSTMNENGYYHSPKLIADGLIKYTGDKASLAKRLWRHNEEWEECLIIGIVQFATSLEDDIFKEEFLDALTHGVLSEDIRFALVRYFRRHYYKPASEVLIKLLEHAETGEDDLAIAAASSLRNYPGDDTKEALKEAVKSGNWYVRRNAAQSLADIGITDKDIEDIRMSNDRYAYEMLDYVIEERRK